MVVGEAIYKSKKLIRVRVEYGASRIKNVRINGDFFLYPEEKIEELEKLLGNVELSKSAISEAVDNFLKQGVCVFGFEKEDITEAILMATGRGQNVN